jgi:hypothetical protein
MRHRNVILLIALGGVPLAACASGSGGTANAPRSRMNTVWFRRDVIPVRRSLSAPVGTIWAALPQSFAELGFPSSASAREGERIYLTPSLRIHGQLYKGELNSVYLDCGNAAGGGRAADSYEVTFAMLARLTPQDSGSTLVEVLVDGSARDRTLNLSNALSCTGTGRLEKEFLQRLEAHIGQKATEGPR